MIKRIPECSKPKVWCPREDYYFPEDGISMSITSAFPSPNNEKSKISIYRNAEMKRENDATFILQLSKAIDSKNHSNASTSGVSSPREHPSGRWKSSFRTSTTTRSSRARGDIVNEAERQ